MRQNVLITGASSGIGEASAYLFARKGYDLILVARSQDRLETIRDKIFAVHGVNVKVIAMDLTMENAALRIKKQLDDEKIRVDILLNNAGFGDCAPFLESSWEKQRQMVALNITALMQMSYVFGGEMKKRGSGKILNVASIAGLCAGPYMSVYYASKAFVISFSEALAMELSHSGVQVTCLCPGPTRTRFMETANLGESPMFKMFKPARVEDVAKLGVNALLKGRRLVIHGLSGHMLNLTTRLLPRRVVEMGTAYVNGRRLYDE